MSEAFEGKAILVVEDNPLIALEIADRLEDEGATVLGPVSSVKSALAILDARTVDAALLDINLVAETSYPIADRLLATRTPFLFVTSMEKRVVPEGYREFVIHKMASIDVILRALFPG